MIKGTVVAITSSEKKGEPKRKLEAGFFISNFGLEGDAHAGKGHRQVSLFSEESAKAMQESGMNGFCTAKFAENLTTKGIRLWELPVGTQLKIGETIQEVTQIGKACHAGCAIREQAGTCIMPTQGIFTRVLQGGKIVVGDEILVLKMESNNEVKT